MASDPISQGNNAAESEEKQASPWSSAHQLIVVPNIKTLYLPEENAWLLQERAQPQGDWLQKQGCYVLPQSQATQTLTDIHQALHIGTKPLYHLLRPLITYPNLLSLLWQVTHSCIICSSVSLQGALKPILSFPTHQAPGHIPGEDWQIDFTHMPPTRKIKACLL